MQLGAQCSECIVPVFCRDFLAPEFVLYRVAKAHIKKKILPRRTRFIFFFTIFLTKKKFD